MHEIAWAGQETTEARGPAPSLLICSQLWLRSVGFKHSGLRLFFFLKFANPVWARVIFPAEVNGSLVTDEADLDNVPAFASNDAGGDHPEKE